MKENAYNRYITESSGWLHAGRSALVERLLGFFMTPKSPAPDILEIGAGVGQNVPALRKFGTVDVLEIDEKGLAALRERRDVREVIDQGIPCPLARTYDIICAFDVIEHIEDDRGALQWIAQNLKPGGLFLATVPAHQWFFTQHDVALGHHRRYTQKTFRSIIPEEFELLADSHFNTTLFPLAIAARVAWVLKNRLRPPADENKQPVPGKGMLSRLLLSIFMWEIGGTSPRTSRPFGLSYYACMRKKT
ncbi:class I SAM-dependent methyltransferase [Hydrogenophaga sp. SL48]|uniref:class I SAM-dependent methyltransferase n=1 Tax=Hydrogenophaga sp. SL48 TaxID=2806347 RepID=UPI001F199DB2|nr:class I SAM-dependent methyltransferase [Hydrogenophaga sp. SL48]UJW81804.1 class I SAM-dependent methyltransferase [Hydrogenophaga sp. SL48]